MGGLFIMSDHCYNELSNIQLAFNTLCRYNKLLSFPVPEKTFANPLLTEYFESNLDDQIEAYVEKILSVAAASIVYDTLELPQKIKKKLALKNARELREAMRYAKLEYHAMVKRDIFVPEYNSRKRSLSIVQRAARLERVKKYATVVTVRFFAKALIGDYSDLIICSSLLIWKFLPDNIRNLLARNTKNICGRAIITIKNYRKVLEHALKNSVKNSEIIKEYDKTEIVKTKKKVKDLEKTGLDDTIRSSKKRISKKRTSKKRTSKKKDSKKGIAKY